MISRAKNLLGLNTKAVLGISAKTALGIGAKTALGIDISNKQISFALLKKTSNGFKVVKTINEPIPDEAIKNGNIEDPVIIAKTIKRLKTDNKIRASHVILSLPANSILSQIIDMPDQISTNIRQFVQNEIKHYVVLADKDVTSDFFAIGPRQRLSNNRLFVAAADSQELNDITKAIIQTDVNLEAIEPALIAYIRAFYAKKVAEKFGCNILLAILKDGILNICVFRNRTLDFIRIKDFNNENCTPDELCHYIAEQINTVIQFYDIEISGDTGKWEVTVITDNSMELPQDTEETLKTRIPNTDLQLRTPEDAWQDTPVDDSINSNDEKPSPVAIGLAMKFLDSTQSDLKINLIPPEIIEIKSTIKQALVTTIIVIAILFAMMLISSGPAGKEGIENATRKKHEQLSSKTSALIEEHKLLDKEIKQLSNRIKQAEKIVGLQQKVDWPRLFKDIKNGIPKSVRITGLFGRGNCKMVLHGTAMSYRAVNLFVDMLNKSELVTSASLIKTEKDEAKGSLVRYSIECSLAEKKGHN
ncbi:MAG: pilus assembly protein PilM [Planctomycetes bacterium]|nr:pilus assembly protein PilM [Planctomycetota bacterium]